MIMQPLAGLTTEILVSISKEEDTTAIAVSPIAKEPTISCSRCWIIEEFVFKKIASSTDRVAILSMFAPRILPHDKEGASIRTAVIEVTSSGREVAPARRMEPTHSLPSLE